MTGMCREDALGRIRERQEPWDIVVIGGGATGVGVALDAASRGLDVLLVEQADFGKGTSSRSTKLVHGGVRYLRQGNITLVRDALRERTLLRNNAPHLVHDMEFLIPCRSLWQRFFYGVGLKVYDLLAVRNSFGRSHAISSNEAIRRLPTLSRESLRGGVIYHDGQFDDSRLLFSMARTAHDQGACLVNYLAATALNKDPGGKITGLIAVDGETGDVFEIQASSVVNAAGPFCDAVRELDDSNEETMIAPSQGVHIVLPREFFPNNTAMIVPKTSDGRVIFIIPWHNHAIVGTTDTAIPEAVLEPTAKGQEVEFLLATAGEYLNRQPTLSDVLSIFVGIRPLVKGDKSARTASLSRDHTIRVSTSGLVTLTGGKWTTVRKMAEDCVDRIVNLARLNAKACQTESLKLHGYLEGLNADPRGYYGTDLPRVQQLESDSPDLAELLHQSLLLRGSDVVWAVRQEMARTLEDVLARRNRSLFLNANAAIEVAPRVAELMADELGKDTVWCTSQLASFHAVAEHYRPAVGNEP